MIWCIGKGFDGYHFWGLVITLYYEASSQHVGIEPLAGEHGGQQLSLYVGIPLHGVSQGLAGKSY